jgi:uncharacterized membrane protein (DUF485 family)
MATITSKGKLNIGYKGKMFQTPKCEYQLTHTLPDAETPEETKLLVAAFKKLYTKGFIQLNKQRAKKIKIAMDGTEKDWKKKPPKNMQTAIKIANSAIEQGVKIWRDIEIVKLNEQCIENVYVYMEKKLKKKINRKKAKTVLKIVLLVLIVVAAAAISIATAGLAAPLAGGITAGVVLGMVATGGGAIYKSGQIILKENKAYEGFLEKIKADIAAIDKAVAYQKKKAGFKKLGPKEKVKLMMSGTKSHAKSLKKHLEAARGRLILMRKANLKAIVDANEAAANWTKMSGHPDKAASKEGDKASDLAARTARIVEKFDEKLNAFDKLEKEAKIQLAQLDKKGEFANEKLTGLVNIGMKHQGTVTSVATGGKTLFTLAKKLKGALPA